MTAALTVAGYAATASIIATYARLSHTSKPRAFHWANFLGCIPLVALNARAHVWPVVALEVFFGLCGAYGLARGRPHGLGR